MARTNVTGIVLGENPDTANKCVPGVLTTPTLIDTMLASEGTGFKIKYAKNVAITASYAATHPFSTVVWAQCQRICDNGRFVAASNTPRLFSWITRREAVGATVVFHGYSDSSLGVLAVGAAAASISYMIMGY